MKFPPIPPVVLLRPVPPLQGCVSSEGQASTPSNAAAQAVMHSTFSWGGSVLPNRLPRLLLNMQLRQQRTKWLRQPSTPSAIRPSLTQPHDVKITRSAMMQCGYVASQRGEVTMHVVFGCLCSHPALLHRVSLCVDIAVNRILSEEKQQTKSLLTLQSSCTCSLL